MHLLVLIWMALDLICHEKCHDDGKVVNCVSTWNDCAEDK